MTRLSDLHKVLLSLKHRRRRFRWVTGYSPLATALLWALAIAFPLDWYFQQSMDVWQRLAMLVFCVAVVIWAFLRYALPWLGQRESELDLALLVERQEHIDTDLVAALEFEWPDAPTWGSVQLEEAVIDNVAVTGKRLNVMQNLPKRELTRRVETLAVTVGAWVLVAALLPQHVAVFFSRLLLGSRHYPTQTQIDSIVINGREIEPASWSRKPIRLRYGQAVKFELRGSGELPAAGTAELTARQTGLQASVTLNPIQDQPGSYVGELPRLIESVRCQLYLGDAWTDPTDLVSAQLPVIELEAEVVPPDYVNRGELRAVPVPRGMRQFSVIEGSEVRLKVRSDKPLKEVSLTLDDKSHLLARDESSTRSSELWVPGEEETPLACVLQPVRFAIQVTDFDEQQLERPLEGAIRIQADLPPRVAAATRTPYVVPIGKPTIYYRAIDDHALGRIWLAYEIVPGKKKGSTEGNAAGDIRTGEIKVYDLAKDQPPLKNLDGEHPADLSPLGLAKGDTLRLTVWAQDYRGPREGKSASSEAMVFHVTDEQGILASMLEADKLSAKELKAMIQRQLGIGESP